jgi:chromosome segregation ATPase
MNNYMRRLSSVSSKKKKTSNKDDDKNKPDATTKTTTPPPSETAAAPIKPRSFRRRSKRLIPPPSETTAEVSSSVAAKTGTKLGRDRFRRLRNGGGGGSSSSLLPSSSSNNNNNNNNNVEATDNEPPTKEDSWMSLAMSNDSSDNGNSIGSINNNTNDNITRSVILEKENLEGELADVQLDRDIMRQQLLDARAELVGARTSLRDHITDLEHQLRTFQQSQQRQTELEENSLLEQELDQLARLTKEQEEKTQLAIAAKEREESFHSSSIDGGGGDSVNYDSFSIASMDGASSIHIADSSSPERHSARLYKERVVELEDALKQRKFRENILEKEVRQLKKQAQAESEKFKETQRQVQFFQEELQAMAGQEESLSLSQGIVRGTYSNNIDSDNDNVDNTTDLGIILEDSDGGNDDGEVNKEEDDNDNHLEIDKEVANDDNADVNDDIVGRNITAESSSSPPSSSNSREYSNHVMILHQQRLELESRVQALLDEVRTLRQDQGTFEHEKQQHSIKVQQLQTDIQQQQAENQFEKILVERQLKEWKDRSDSFQQELQEERNLAEHQHVNTRLERHEWHRRVEELEINKSELEEKLKKDGVQFYHEQGLLKRAVQSLEKEVQDASVASVTNIDDNDTASQSQALSHKEHEGLVDRIKILEVDIKSREESEHTLREQYKDMTEQAKDAKNKAAKADDRVHILQTFLGVSMSASPSRDRQLELEQEYFSVHAQIDDKVKNKLQVVSEDETQGAAKIDGNPFAGHTGNSDYHNAIKDETFFEIQEEACKFSVDSAQKLSTESRARILKMRNMEEQSKSNNALVNNLHLKLSQEMEQLKQRKERRRERSISSTSPDQSVRKYRSLLDASSNGGITFKNEKNDIDPNAAATDISRSSKEVSLPEALPVKINGQIESGQSVDSAEHHRDTDLNRTEILEIVETDQPNISKGDNYPDLFTQTATHIKDRELVSSDRVTLEGTESESLQCVADYEDRLQTANVKVNRLQKELSEAQTILKDALLEHSEYQGKLIEKSAAQESLEAELSELKCEKEDLESKLKEKAKVENELIGDLIKRQAAALEAVNDDKARLEIQLEDAAKQTKSSVDQVNALRSQITEYCLLLDQNEAEKMALREQISEKEKEKSLLEASYASKLTAEQSFLSKMEQIEITLVESRKERDALEVELERERAEFIQVQSTFHAEKDDNTKIEIERLLEEKVKSLEEEKEILSLTHKDHCEALGRKIILLETDSKANIERLSIGMESVLEERNLAELKVHDANKLLDESKERESTLERSLQEALHELKSSQDEFQNMSKTKEHENTEFESKKLFHQATILEKNQLITDMEKDFSCSGKRLEQASMKLSELEKELFERDEEIESLDAKRQQIEDKASKQLIEMENLLQEHGEEIDRLEEEKSKLQDSAQKYEDQIEKQVGRLAEASLQLSELEGELFAKDDDIEDIELKLNTLQAVEAQRVEALEDLESQKRDLLKQLENANAQIEEIKEKTEIEKTEEIRRVSIEKEQKDNELVMKDNQLNRQLQTVSKLTEQTDNWQQQLDIVHDEKKELVDNLADVTKQVASLREDLKEANEKIDGLNSIHIQLQDDLLCATEEEDKNHHRISQMEEQKEALSQKLESVVDDLAAIDAVEIETDIEIGKLTEDLESTRQSLRTTELQRNDLHVENQSLTNRIRMLVEIEAENNDTDVADGLRNTRERLVDELTTSLNISRRRDDEIQTLEGKIVDLEEHLELMEEGDTNKEQIILSLEGELQQMKDRMGDQYLNERNSDNK